jgi:small subunit ribosomal protein S17
MKTYTGVVISDKMTNTIVVEVARDWVHPIYKKTVKRTKKYPVHDEKSIAKIGDTVSFSESKPFSKTVHFTLNQVVQKATAVTQAIVEQEATAKETVKKA